MSQFFLAVGFVFDEKGNLLLLKRKDRQAWEPVKGWVEPWETPEAGVWRELLEETGLSKEDVVSIQSHELLKQIETGDTYIASFTIVIKGTKPPVQINYISEWGEDHEAYWWFSAETIEWVSLDALSADLTKHEMLRYNWNFATN